MVVACFDDEENKSQRDDLTKLQTGSKAVIKQVRKLQKIESWKKTIEKMYKRRLARQNKGKVLDSYVDSNWHSR